jgi:hypothetical protein
VVDRVHAGTAMEFDLRHYGRDVFILSTDRRINRRPLGVHFSIDPGRHADRVLFENLDVHGQGAISRMK